MLYRSMAQVMWKCPVSPGLSYTRKACLQIRGAPQYFQEVKSKEALQAAEALQEALESTSLFLGCSLIATELDRPWSPGPCRACITLTLHPMGLYGKAGHRGEIATSGQATKLLRRLIVLAKANAVDCTTTALIDAYQCQGEEPL